MKFPNIAFGLFYFCGFSWNFCFPFSTTVEYLNSCGQEINVENLGTNLVNSLVQLRKIDFHSGNEQLHTALSSFKQYSAYILHLKDKELLSSKEFSEECESSIMTLRISFCFPSYSEANLKGMRTALFFSHKAIDDCIKKLTSSCNRHQD